MVKGKKMAAEGFLKVFENFSAGLAFQPLNILVK
jgi:hypothetical protein